MVGWLGAVSLRVVSLFTLPLGGRQLLSHAGGLLLLRPLSIDPLLLLDFAIGILQGARRFNGAEHEDSQLGDSTVQRADAPVNVGIRPLQIDDDLVQPGVWMVVEFRDALGVLLLGGVRLLLGSRRKLLVAALGVEVLFLGHCQSSVRG